MPRVILLSGKGGVGKTTVAAATALAAAARGHRSLVISFDLAHSLSDSFDLGRELFDQQKGEAAKVAPNLDMQEIDVQEELSRHWSGIYEFATIFMSSTGISSIVAEELAIVPGMEDVIALLYINQYLREDRYDVIVVDCPPTTDALRFVSMTTTLNWYVRSRLKLDRTVLKVARPVIKTFSPAALPEDNYFTAIEGLVAKLDGIESTLLDPNITSVRLVTNAERMVVRETQRAFMFFNMYGVVTDRIIINRLLPDRDDSMNEWRAIQARYVAEIEGYFKPVTVSRLPLLDKEVLGVDALAEIGELVYGGEDPAAVVETRSPYRFEKEGEAYRLRMAMPFVRSDDLDLYRQGEDLIVRVGSFKRYVGLPRGVCRLAVAGASFEGPELVVKFA